MKKYTFPVLIGVLVFVVAFGVLMFVYTPSSQNSYSKNNTSFYDDFEEVSKEEAEKYTTHHDGKYTIEVKSGDTLLSMLTEMGVDYKHANDVFISIRKVSNPRDLRIGQKIEIETATIDGSYMIKSLTTTLNTGQHLNVTINDDKTYSVRIDEDKLTEEMKLVFGEINGTVSDSMHNNGVPSRIVANFIHIFSDKVDFRQDLKKGDTYAIVYKNYILPDRNIAKNGEIVYASLITNGKKRELYRFKNASGDVGYYTAEGTMISNYVLIRRLTGKDLERFKKKVDTINVLVEMQKSGECGIECKSYIKQDRSVEVLAKLKERLSRDVMRAIESIELKYDERRRQEYTATVYIKHGYEYLSQGVSRRVVLEILHILMEEGHKPSDEEIAVFAFISKRVKGVTGKNLVEMHGFSSYDYYHDKIDWTPPGSGIFGL